MKSFALSLLVGSSLVFGATGCRPFYEMTLERNSASPLTLEQSGSVPVYTTSCSTQTVYGADSSCGSHQECHTVYEHNDPNYGGGGHGDGDHDGDDHHGDGGYHGGGDYHGPNYNPTPHPHPHPYGRKDYESCSTYYNSCYHPETSCYEVLDHQTQVTLRLHFDPRAVLQSGQVEKIDLRFSGRESQKELRIKIKSPKYVYDLPGVVPMDLSGSYGVFDVNLPVKKVRGQ